MSSKHWKYLAAFVAGGLFFAPVFGFVRGIFNR